MKLSWWKYLAILLVSYSLIAGLIIPLGFGITKSEPFQAQMGGTLEVKAETYNIIPGSDLEGFLRIDSFLLKANEVKVSTSEANDIRLKFDLPDYLPINAKQKDATLIINQKGAGAAVLPSAIFLKQDLIDVASGQKSWGSADILKGEDLVGKTHFPYRSILYETIRNTFYHVPMWFAMIFMFTLSVISSILLLRKPQKVDYDMWTMNLNRVGVLFGILGLLTGAVWARYTWGSYWSGDIKQNMSAICLLIYGGYFILRATVDDIDKKRRITSIFNIFAYIAMIPLLFVIPRMTDSLHPGSGGNPALGGDDLDSTMRMIFYPAIIGWILFGIWMSEIGKRYEKIKTEYLIKIHDKN